MRPLLLLILLFTLSSCFVSKADLNGTSSLTQWLDNCMTVNRYCAAVRQEVGSKQVSVLFPNVGREALAAGIDKLSDAELSKLVRHNIFPVERLSTGKLTSLAGVTHDVQCDSEGKSCSIGKLKMIVAINNRTPQEFGGMVYQTNASGAEAGQFNVLGQ